MSPISLMKPRRGNNYQHDGESMGRFHKWFCALTPNFCALRPTFEKLFSGTNDGRRARIIGAGHKMVFEIDPIRAAAQSAERPLHGHANRLTLFDIKRPV